MALARGHPEFWQTEIFGMKSTRSSSVDVLDMFSDLDLWEGVICGRQAST
jgi:hypothetical protein